jgi:hypothetical protein
MVNFNPRLTLTGRVQHDKADISLNPAPRRYMLAVTPLVSLTDGRAARISYLASNWPGDEYKLPP